ncbi:6-phosphofructokinase 1 [Terribacillus halophilus]|uniref:ATP-dependent 6-phosphofructokinase n=1 Tax=Terribacillus halophilus TaxID=361279 RepID=A0A1G6IV74_9BACI|nr:6-phosphofructokinase [Terribacillus halophilus]SDC10388.1 6-phosphofructokinase 1 [Terribacillus halophilus]
MIHKVAVITSGGDSPGMNAAIRAIVKAANYHDIEVYGVEGGYQGLIEDKLSILRTADVETIANKGGTILKTSRSLAFMNDSGRKQAVEVLRNYGIADVIVIGGEGSLQGAQKLHELGIRVIGIPGTIDNDLDYTDYCIGFDTTLNTVLSSLGRIKDTGLSHNKTTIVEVMGRHCGDLALFTAVAGEGDIISTPEHKLSFEQICEKLQQKITKGRNDNIIVVTERMYDLDELQQHIEEQMQIEVRTTVLGFIQRGGEPSAFDRILANKMGVQAVKMLMEGQSGFAIGIKANQLIAKDLQTMLDEKKDKQASYDLLDMLLYTT